MHSPTLTLFNHLTDEDFIAIHKAGQLKSLCLALSMDIEASSSSLKNDLLN
mgnify:FL=1|tara:strand:- start:669 stop:821 length:153 start_codon:yes stop_codon:yes gene_type:complete